MSSPSRYRQKKDGNQPEIIAALEKIGCSVTVMHQPCDLLVGLRLETFCLEVKLPKGGKVTPAQKKWNAEWRGHRATVTTPEEAIAAILGAMRFVPRETLRLAELG